MKRKRDDMGTFKGSSMEKEKHFEEVYRRYFTRLYTYSKVICKSSELAKDVVSDLFYSLWKNQTDLSTIKELETYLFVSVRNKAIKAVQRDKKSGLPQDFDSFQHSIDYIDPEELLIEKELRNLLDRAVENLPRQCQLIFRMAKERGMKYTGIAEELGVSVETVKSQLKRAHSKLKIEILKFYEDKQGNYHSDIRVIGQLLLFAGLASYEFFN